MDVQFDAKATLNTDALPWLETQLGIGKITADQILENEGKNKDVVTGHELSLPQRWEAEEAKRVESLLEGDALIQFKASCGKEHKWITIPPIRYKNQNLRSEHWRFSALRRLRLPVHPFPDGVPCPACPKGKGWLDQFGDHAVTCPCGVSRILRHDAGGRDVLFTFAKNAGLRPLREQHCVGLEKNHRCDVLLPAFHEDGRGEVVDVFYTDIRSGDGAKETARNGAGAAALHYGRTVKEPKYATLDPTLYKFTPFGIETSGALSKPALTLVEKLEEKAAAIKSPAQGTLLSKLSLECARHCGAMIAERQPLEESHTTPKLLKIEQRNNLLQREAIRRREEETKRIIIREAKTPRRDPTGSTSRVQKLNAPSDRSISAPVEYKKDKIGPLVRPQTRPAYGPVRTRPPVIPPSPTPLPTQPQTRVMATTNQNFIGQPVFIHPHYPLLFNTPLPIPPHSDVIFPKNHPPDPTINE